MSELALQKLNELREVAPTEVEELIDGLATLLVLRQDMSNPMLGAKVTVWLRPPHTPAKAPVGEVPEGLSDWQVPFTSDDPERWEEWSFDWIDGGPPDEPPGEVAKVYLKDDRGDPDLVPHQAIVFEGNVAGDAPDGPLWDPNVQAYTTADDYPLGTVNCIIACHYRREDELFPRGFTDEYPSNVKVYTSITPADGDLGPHEYTPGWPD